MPATVTVKYLGDEKVEKSIRVGLEAALKDYEDRWRVSVLGSAGSDFWEIKVEQPQGGQHWVKKLDAHQTVEKVVEEATHMVRLAAQSLAS
jgi:hypothetical protein